jgi:hypothetical protein
MPFKVVTQKGFLKGVIASMDRFNVTKGAVQRSSNFLLSQRGALTVCDGTSVTATDASGTNPGSPIEEIALFVEPGNLANPFPVMAAPNGNNMGIYQWSLTPGAGFTNLGLLDSTPGWDMPQMLNMSGNLIIALGNGAPIVKMTNLPSLGGAFSNLGAGTTSPPTWQANTYYQIGQRIAEPSSDPGGNTSTLSTWQVVNVQIGNANSGGMSNTSGIGSGGMSGTTEPTFGNPDAGQHGSGQTAHDNQIIWMCIKQDQGDLAKTYPPAGAQHIITHANSLWAWNTAPQTSVTAGGSIDGPSVLRMSDPNNPDSWPIGNTTTIGEGDGTQGTGLATFTVAEAGITPTGTLVVFKDYSTYTVTGVFQAQDFATNQVKTDMGCLAPRSIVFATGFGVVRFSHLGFALFDGINDRLVSEEIRPYIFGDKVTPGVDFTRLSKARAALTANPPLYACSMPTTDGNTTRIFVYDLVMRAWMVCDYMNSSSLYPITAMAQLRPPQVSGLNAVTVLADFGPGNVASIRRWQNGDAAWDATSPPTPIAWSFRPPEVGEPGSRAYFRRANVRLTAPQAGQITGNFNIGEESQPANVRLEGGAGPSSGTAPNIATTANYYGNEDLGVALDVHQTGPSLNGTFSGTGPANVEGVDYHITGKQPRPFGQRF